MNEKARNDIITAVSIAIRTQPTLSDDTMTWHMWLCHDIDKSHDSCGTGRGGLEVSKKRCKADPIRLRVMRDAILGVPLHEMVLRTVTEDERHCHCIIKHAVTADDRTVATQALDYARSIGDETGIMLAMAALGECKTVQ